MSYDATAEAVHGIDFEVEPGKLVAIVGGPGSGKTTLAHLIPRFYDVTSGHVAIDGHDVRDVALASLIPNPPKDTDGRREDSGRGWVRELQGRWPGVLG